MYYLFEIPKKSERNIKFYYIKKICINIKIDVEINIFFKQPSEKVELKMNISY